MTAAALPLALYIVQLASSWFMTGLIWFVQIVHYPLLPEVGEAIYPRYQAGHMKRTGWVVAPVMLVELVTAVAAIWAPPPGLSGFAVWTGLALLGAIWLSTFLFQIPAHDRLSRGLDRPTQQLLVRGNWIRTIAWTSRAVLLLGPLTTISTSV